MTESETGDVVPAEETSERVPGEAESPRWKRIVKRVAIGALSVVVFLVALGVSLYLWGGMWIRTPQMKAAYAEQVSAGQAPAINYRFTIPVPGCVCHSDSPDLQAKHSVRRIRDCMKCHNTNPAHDEPGVQ